MKISIIVVSLFLSISVNAQKVQTQKIKNTIPINSKDAVTLTVKINDDKQTDTMFLYFWAQTIGDRHAEKYMNPVIIRTRKNKEGNYVFILSGIKKIGYFSIGREYNIDWKMQPVFLLDKYLVSPGDDVTVYFKPDANRHGGLTLEQFKKSGFFDIIFYLRQNPELHLNSDIEFSGKGSAKYSARYANDWKIFAEKNLNDNIYNHGALIDSSGKYYDHNNIYEKIYKNTLATMELFRDKMSRDEYDCLFADYLGYIIQLEVSAFSGLFERAKQTGDQKKLSLVKEIYGNGVFREKINLRLSETAFNTSRTYAYSLVGFVKFQKNQFYTSDSSVSIYSLIVGDYEGKLRDKMIALYLTGDYSRVPNFDKVLTDALSVVKDPYYSNNIQELSNSLMSGIPGYNFDLQNIYGKAIKFSEFSGKVVLIDYWYTGCGSCSKFFKEVLSKIEKKYKTNKDVVFMTVSVDNIKSEWKNSVESQQYSSLDVINLYTNGKGTEHPLIYYYKIHAYPHPMIFDRRGNVQNVSLPSSPTPETEATIIAEIEKGLTGK